MRLLRQSYLNTRNGMKNKKREFQSSELVKSFARIYGFEDKLLAFEVKEFLHEYLSDALFNEIESVNLNKKILERQGLVIGAVVFTYLGMKIRDFQMKMAIDKEIKKLKLESPDVDFIPENELVK